jgi:hypothetical protein
LIAFGNPTCERAFLLGGEEFIGVPAYREGD